MVLLEGWLFPMDGDVPVDLLVEVLDGDLGFVFCCGEVFGFVGGVFDEFLGGTHCCISEA